MVTASLAVLFACAGDGQSVASRGAGSVGTTPTSTTGTGTPVRSGISSTSVATESLTAADGRIWTRLHVPDEVTSSRAAVSAEGLWILVGEPGTGRLTLFGRDATVRTAPPFPGGDAPYAPTIVAADGKVAVLFGVTPDNEPTSRAWLFDVGTDRWSELPPPPGTRERHCSTDQPGPSWDGRVARFLCATVNPAGGEVLPEILEFDLADQTWSTSQGPPVSSGHGCRVTGFGARAATLVIPVTRVEPTSYSQTAGGRLELWIRRDRLPWVQGPPAGFEGVTIGRSGPNCAVAAGVAGSSVFVRISTDQLLRRFGLGGDQVEISDLSESFAKGAPRFAPWRMLPWGDQVLIDDGVHLGVLDSSGRIRQIPLPDLVGGIGGMQLVGIADDQGWLMLADGSYLTAGL